jgi:hypothetical protein
MGTQRLIQITPQIRILVAVEPIDARKYAPSTNMRSKAVPARKTDHFSGLGRRITGLPLRSEQGEQFIRRPELTAS